MRMGILVMNGKINNKDTTIQGANSARKFFFPNDNNLDNDFSMIFGTEE